MAQKKYEKGFILSGGGARGFAHLGFIQALNEVGIYPDVVSGTSAGAIAGALYCDGYPPKEILNLLSKESRLDFMRPTLPREGLLQISGVQKVLDSALRAKSFEKLQIPLFVAATDINNGAIVYFSEGSLLDKVMASISIPVLFQPVVIDNIQYLDGGIMDNMPLHPIKNETKHIFGCSVNPIGHIDKVSGLINIAERAFMLSMHKDINEKIDNFDFLVDSPELKNHSILGIEKASEIFDIGYNATIEKLKDKSTRRKIGL